ncbi:MAG: Type restriction enzyme protein [Mucilaginibacter sp.]|nr:Type restriction enzyme protein [Mucilaginibacter sp.]
MTDIKQLLKEFERYAYGQSLQSAFTKLLDWTLLPFKKWDNAELHNQALETYQTHPKATQLVNLVTLIGDASGDFCDPLGELYQQAISNGHNGQYWTPENLCGMIASMSIGETLEDGQRILDPACGSGRMLLAAAKLNRHALFHGADLDLTCCKMSLVNMMLNSLTGEIAHMNSLSNEFFTGFKTQTTIVNGFHIPFYVEFTEPELSHIWLHDLKGTEPKAKFDKPFEPVRVSQPISGVQGSLF